MFRIVIAKSMTFPELAAHVYNRGPVRAYILFESYVRYCAQINHQHKRKLRLMLGMI